MVCQSAMELKARRNCHSFEKLDQFCHFCCDLHRKVLLAKKYDCECEYEKSATLLRDFLKRNDKC